MSSHDLIRYYRDRCVLVTGHTGFKGSWLCSWLLEIGARVSGLALEPDSHPNLFDILRLEDRMTSNICDVRDVAGLRSVLEKTQPEIIFHLAAQPLVRRSYTDPIETFATNIIGTAQLLELARTCSGVRVIVIVTTDKVYDNREKNSCFRETDPLGGLDPYSASKAATELIAAVYQKNLYRGHIALATARGGNVIGGGDWSEDRIVPDIVRAISANAPIVLRYPDAIRPWQHVLELSEAYLELGAHLLEAGSDFAEPWNFGPRASEDVTVGELTKMFLEIWGRPDYPIEVKYSPLHEAETLRLDISKALSRLRWHPRLGIRDALDWTARWYKDFYERPQSACAATADQINTFTALIDKS